MSEKLELETVLLWIRANISMAKKARGLMDKQIAERMGIDISNVTKERLGLSNIGLRRLVQWANALEVTPAQLLTEPANLDAALAIDHRSRQRKKLPRYWRTKSITQQAGL